MRCVLTEDAHHPFFYRPVKVYKGLKLQSSIKVKRVLETVKNGNQRIYLYLKNISAVFQTLVICRQSVSANM